MNPEQVCVICVPIDQYSTSEANQNCLASSRHFGKVVLVLLVEILHSLYVQVRSMLLFEILDFSSHCTREDDCCFSSH